MLQEKYILFSESSETISSEKALQMVRQRFPQVISHSEEIAQTIDSFVMSYCVNRQVFVNQTDFLNTVDKDVSEFFYRKAEEGGDEDGSSEEEIEELIAEESSSLTQTDESIPQCLYGSPEKAMQEDVCVLFRVVSQHELAELWDEIQKKSHFPIFHHSPKQKGMAEKFFAENKKYLVAAWLSKGKRGKQNPTILRIICHKSVLKEVLLNSTYASLNKGAEGEDDLQHLKLANAQYPTPILIKRESPKGKKGISYSSRTFGFRKSLQGNDTDIFVLLAKYIVSVDLVTTD
ncbi:MAG TPA: hypothetical protein VGD98_03290 [Ktedonobacteraceae bacterium]